MYPSTGLFFAMIVAGFPITRELSGISVFTNEFGAINTLFPTFIFPTITEPVPIQTLSPIVGQPFKLPLFV